MKRIADFEDLDVNRCPVCGCPDIKPSSFEKLQKNFYVLLECTECGASWGIKLSGAVDAFFDIKDSGYDVLEEWVE